MKKTIRLSMLLAISIVLSIIENLIPLFNNIIPGLKLGLANIVVVITLYMYGLKDALKISIIRVFVVGILRTGLFNSIFLFSIVGALFSSISMGLFKKMKLSIIGVSIMGSVFHGIGQIVVACIIINNAMIYYLPYLILLSILTGTIIGIISKKTINTGIINE